MIFTEKKNLNISFVKLGNEECETCEIFSLHDPSHDKNNLVNTCKICSEWQIHHEKYNSARNKYQEHTDLQNIKQKKKSMFQLIYRKC